MASLKLNVTGQLNNLVPVSGSTYKFLVRYYSLGDVLLPNSQLIQGAESVVTLIDNEFDLSFPLGEGDYAIPNVKIRLYNNSLSSDCYAELVKDIVVNCDTDVCSPVVGLTGTFSQSCSGSNVILNGTSLVSSGGTSPYQYAIVKTSDFTSVDSLTWGSTKTFTVLPNTQYRVYTRGTETSNNSSCYAYVSVTSINCDVAPTTCSPVVSITGTTSQICTDSAITLTGTSLTGNGGNGSYLWAIIETSSFTNVEALSFSTTKTWTIQPLVNYRVYVKDTSGINHSTCYAYISVTGINCDVEPEDCDPPVTLTGTPTQTCDGFANVTVNGTSLIAAGGNTNYLYSTVKQSEFTSIGALTWSSGKIWTLGADEIYRIYVKDTSGVNDSTCYSYIVVNTIECSDPDPEEIVEKQVGKGMDEHMNIVFTGEGLDRTFSDLSTVPLTSGYEWRYFINDNVIRTSTPLTNYPWQSTSPLGILKIQVKIGTTPLAFWGSQEWQDPDLGLGFSYNSSVAFTSFLFEPSGEGYDITRQVVHWMDHMPNVTLPNDGDIWFVPVGPIDSPNFLAQKGITHFIHGDLDSLPFEEREAYRLAGRTYMDVPKTMTQLNLNEYGPDEWVGPPGGSGQYPEIWNQRIFHTPPGATAPMTNAAATAAGNSHSIQDAMIIWENGEQYYAVGTQWEFWRYFYDALTARLETAFPGKWRIAHNYFDAFTGNFTHDTTRRSLYGEYPFLPGTNSRTQAKAFFNAPLSEYPFSQFLPGGTLEKVNMVTFGVYLSAPDSHADMLYRFIHQSYVQHKANKYLTVFIQSFYEWRPNNLLEIQFPEGKFYQYIKLPHNPCIAMNLAFLSRVFADGFVPWSSASKTELDLKWNRTYWNDSLWIPNGYTSPQSNDLFPYWGTPEHFPAGLFEEMVARGMYKYYDTFAQTLGGDKYFLKFRVDGGAWVDPIIKTDGSDIIDAIFDKRPIVYAEIKDGKMAVFYMNAYENDGLLHTVEFVNPIDSGITYTMEVASILVWEKLIIL